MAVAFEPGSTVQALINVIPPDEIPIKLRCAICNRLAVNAFKLPCCDQAICESCQSSLPNACPVCEHTPLSADDCKPNKALRTTIRVFLRTEEKKRDLQKPKVTPVVIPTVVSVREPSADGAVLEVALGSEAPLPASFNVTGNEPQSIPQEITESGANLELPAQTEEKDVPQQSIEKIVKGQEFVESQPTEDGLISDGVETGGTKDAGTGDGRPQALTEDEGKVKNSTAQLQSGTWAEGQNQQEVPQIIANGGFDMGASNGYGNMAWNQQMAFDPMMQSMPNMLPNSAWGTFSNMMGMPGMTLDTATISQGMYGAFGGQGMGMNGMNSMTMGMGMGFDQGGYNGWTRGQDKFNPNAYGGSANGIGDFGANAGYIPSTGGYNMPNHGNFSQMHAQHYQGNVSQNGFSGPGQFSRGRGRGRAFSHSHGRGGYANGAQSNGAAFHQQLPLNPPQPVQQALQTPSDSATNPASAIERTETDTNITDCPLSKEFEGNRKNEGAKSGTAVKHTSSGDDNAPSAIGKKDPDHAESSTAGQDDTAVAIAGLETLTPVNDLPSNTILSDGSVPLNFDPFTLMNGGQQHAFAGRGRGVALGSFRGGPGFRGRGAGAWPQNTSIGRPTQSVPTQGFPNVAPVEPKGQGVIGAPKAPKALRQGLPNTGMSGRPLGMIARGSKAINGGPSPTIASVPEDQPRSETPERRRSRSRSRSTSRHRSRHHRRHRHRSPTLSEDESGREQKRQRHSRHSKGDQYDETEEVDRPAEDKTSYEVSRTGSRSKSQSPRSSHRSRREKDYKDSIKYRSTHRSDRDRDGSRERRHRRKRSRSGSQAREKNFSAETTRNDFSGVPTGPRASRTKENGEDRLNKGRDRNYNRQDRSRSRSADDYSRHRSHRSKRDDDKGRTRDAERNEQEQNSQDREREERNRERLLKEQERRDEINREREYHDRERRKRDRGGVEDETGGDEERSKRRRHRHKTSAGGRRISVKYEDEESDEARALRVESEREAARWS